jgi:steroid 5-alpha reductase family enzyme
MIEVKNMDIKRIIIYTLLFIITFAVATLGFTRLGLDGLLIPALVTLGYFTVIFIVAQIVTDNSIVDMGWGLGFVIGSWTTLLITENPTLLSFIIVGFITLWGLRLSARLIKRNFGKPEDFRYQQWRKEWGDKVVIIAFFRVFMIQGIINFIVGAASYSVIKFNQFSFDDGLSLGIVGLGLLIAIIGLFFEVVGDEQLRRHIKEGTKTLMDKGLWSLTRHPNYFGEILIWTGLYIAGLSLIINDSINIIYYLLLIVSPLIMSLVLIKISTPLLEKHMKKYEGWETYTKKVPMIFPWGKKG